ncbi:hypothetical protein BJX63DRAFT_383417 [Aspergillus granulosus]|uniref:BZIP domain-containing protein n=1 Tax=Aspergillus granulosus TaxID=176169 RepID=A0ABR4HT68_9EURO
MAFSQLSNSPVQPKPWSSGRTLTPAQRERKRFKDRMSKRQKNEKEKEVLAELQNQVAALHKLIQSHTSLGSENSPWVLPPDDFNMDILVPPSNSHRSLQDEPNPLATPPQSAPQFNAETEQREPSQTEPLVTWTKGHQNTWSNIGPSLQEGGSRLILEFTDEILGKTLGFNTLDICSSEELNQDAVIRGVLEGWHTVESRTYSCPLWKIISQIDERIFIHGGILTRLTMLSTILKMLVAVVYQNSFAGVPPWYRPRPGFRERLVLSDCEILTDRFFKCFASCFRLSWPHSISSAYVIQPGGELYSFSDEMCGAFFSLFPALEEDMLSGTISTSSGCPLALDILGPA